MAGITVHPGGFVKRNYVEALGLNQAELAEALDVSAGTLNGFFDEQADLSPELAIKLSKVLGRSPESWMAMQSAHTLALCQREMATWVPPRSIIDSGQRALGGAQPR